MIIDTAMLRLSSMSLETRDLLQFVYVVAGNSLSSNSLEARLADDSHQVSLLAQRS